VEGGEGGVLGGGGGGGGEDLGLVPAQGKNWEKRVFFFLFLPFFLFC